MKGWTVRRLGDPADVLEFGELPDPGPGPGQVLVLVHAVACNFPDILVCQGKYQEKPELPFTPGMEIAGEVVAAGEGARAAVGDRVLGTPPMGRGGYAELAVLDAASTHPWPEGMRAAQAAGLFVTYQTGVCALAHRGRNAAGCVARVRRRRRAGRAQPGVVRPQNDSSGSIRLLRRRRRVTFRTPPG